jgi:hypothetical protein
LTQAKPWWALAADAAIRMGAGWADQTVPVTDPRYFIYANCPPHKQNGNPVGGAEVFADGSSKWVKWDAPWRRYSYWAGAYGSTYVWWYQESVDFDASLKLYLPVLEK